MMKLSILILSIAVMGVFCGEDKFAEQRMAHRDTCLKESGATEEETKNLDKLEETGKAACYIKCMGQKMGILTGEVKIDAAKLKEIVGEKINSHEDGATVEQVVEKCGALSGGNECETAAKIFNCAMAMDSA